MFYVELLFVQQTESWHQSEHHKHCEVHRTRDLVPATKVLRQSPILKKHGQPQLSANSKSQSKKSNYPRTTTEVNLREVPQYVACSKENRRCHYGHFRQFRPALSDSWNEKRNPDNTERKPSAEHDRKVHKASANGF